MRKRKTLLLSLAALAAVTGAAMAQSARMSAAEARAELFGIEMSGVVEGPGDSWTECVGRDGRTVYRRGRQVEHGRLTITPDGQACFRYEGDSYSSCFDVRREGSNYRFDEFVTRVVRRDVTSCAAGVPIS